VLFATAYPGGTLLTIGAATPNSLEPPVSSEYETSDSTRAGLSEALAEAFESSSTEELESFFKTWHESIPAPDIEVLDDDLSREVYSVFAGFYLQFPLRTDESIGPKSYAIIQDTIRYNGCSFFHR
jgi:hypothetical protein